LTTEPDRRFQIVQVNLQSDRGGDGRIVTGLHERYRALGYKAALLTGRGSITTEGEGVLPNDSYRTRWARAWLALAQLDSSDVPISKGAKLLSWVAEPGRRIRKRAGFEDFEFPATLPTLSRSIGEGPTILHLHNLHGGYFDLRTLPALSHLAPIVLTLHDQWAFTGHCAHSFECERWTLGCGHCPDLTIYPGIPRDRTADNFGLKQRIFSETRLYLTAPSKWLMERAERSLLAPSIEEARVIPNGVDTTVFRPRDRAKERSRLGLPRDSRILLCAGSVARSDRTTDRHLVRPALQLLAEKNVDCTMLFLGSPTDSRERIDGIQFIHRPYERDISKVAGYYSASDIYLHPARADTFPTAVLESLACGVPVIATDVGGIPEQIRSLWATKNAAASSPTSATGILVDVNDAAGIRKAIGLLLSDEGLRASLAENGSNTAVSEFSITRQVERNLDWYEEIMRRRRSGAPPAAQGTAGRRRDLPQ
jgi:glycosyltransferase involved in cell wall biosynthesis